MSYIAEKIENSRVKLSFDVSAETFSKAIDEAYAKNKHKYSVQGFRKGHVPKKVIEGIYGKEVFFEDAMDIVIPEAYGEALQKEEFSVVSQPELTAFDFKDDGGATFTLTVTVKPEVELGAYKGLKIEKKVEKITAKAVDEEVEKACEKQARLVDVDTAAEKGSIVDIDFEGSVDGVKFDGGSAEHYELELGSGTFIPGFEEQLEGVKAGDEKNVRVTFPEDYHSEELKGKDAVFACKVHSVKKKELPKIDDEFVKEISEFNTLKEYKDDIKKKLTQEAELKADREFEDNLIEAVVEGAKVEIPEVMVDNEVEDMIGEFEYRLQYQGLKLDDYLKYLNMSREQLGEEYRPQAQKSVKVRLVMEQIVKAEELRFDEKELDAKIEEAAQSAGKSAEEFKKTLSREYVDYLANQILSEKLIKLLKDENGAEKAEKKAAKPKKEESASVEATEGAEVKEAAPKKKKAQAAEK